MDRIIAMAGQRNTRLLLGLVDNWGHNGGLFQYMAWVLSEHPESLPANLRTNAAIGTIPLHDEFYTNAWAKQWYKDYVTMLLNRTNTISGLKYKDDPVIFQSSILPSLVMRSTIPVNDFPLSRVVVIVSSLAAGAMLPIYSRW